MFYFLKGVLMEGQCGPEMLRCVRLGKTQIDNTYRRNHNQSITHKHSENLPTRINMGFVPWKNRLTIDKAIMQQTNFFVLRGKKTKQKHHATPKRRSPSYQLGVQLHTQ